MAEAVTSGKARYIGLSEVSVDEIKLAQTVHPVATVQSELSLWTRDVLAAVLPYCREQGIALLPFAPLGRGFLAGRFASFEDLPHDDFRRKLPRFQQDALRANLAIVAGVRKVAERIGATPCAGGAGLGARPGPSGRAHPGDEDAEVPRGERGCGWGHVARVGSAELDAIPAPEGSRY